MDEKKIARAEHKYARISPRKVEIICNMIRGKDAALALALMENTPKAGCELMIKVLKSAMANAENNFEMDPEKLYVAETFANAGPILKRGMPRAQGRMYRINKRTSHITLVVKEKEYLVKIGKQTNAEENYYAVMVKDNPSIFEVGADDLPFMNYDEADFASNTLYSCNITEIASLRVQMKGFDHTFQLKHGTDASGEATLAVQTANGQSVVEDDFRTMYMDLLGLNSFENVTDGKDAATPYMTLTLTYHSFDQVDVIRLSPYTDRRYFMSLNGMGSTVILSNTVDQLEQSIRSLVS